MTELQKTQLRWSLIALFVTSVVGLLSYEFVAKPLIGASEAESLRRWMENPEPRELHRNELYRVLADGLVFSVRGEAVVDMGGEEALELALASKGRSGALRGGSVYVSEFASWGEGASGWNLARSDARARLSSASQAIGVVALGLCCSFSLLFYFFQRKLHRRFLEDLSVFGEQLDLEQEVGGGSSRERLAGFASQIQETRRRDACSLAELGRFAAIALNSPEGIFICDSKGDMVWANPAFEKLAGYSLEEIRERLPFAHFETELNDPFCLARLNRALGSREPVSLELGGLRPDGRQYWVSLSLAPLPAKGDEKELFFGIQNDITEKRRADLALEEVSRRFALAIESARVGIWDWDVKRDELVWDDRMHSLYGVSRMNFIPSYRAWMGCIDPDDTNRVVRRIDESLAKGKGIDLVACVARSDGSQAYLKIVGQAFLNEGGEVTRYIGITTDVTEEHKAKRSLIEQKEEAETLAEQLSVAVRESKKAASEADRATRAKSAFLAMMSHEIRTPMNGVIGMASLLLETKLDEHQKDYLNTIRVSGDTLLTLINDILDYSKIESGKLELERAPFSIRECIEDVADLLSSKADEKGVELLCRINLDTPREVIGDVTRLRQILVNLIGNAIKFTEVGEVEVSVFAPQDGKVQFAVRDTGIGIPEDRMDRLFEVFSQVDSSTTRKYGGSGLGLSISKQLAGMMGGTMWVESAVGKGSVFHFDIEFGGLEAADRDPLFSEQEELAGKRAVLVEPNAVCREILSRLIEAWGLELDAFGSIEEIAGAAAREDGYDFVIVDVDEVEAGGKRCLRTLDTLSGNDGLVITLLNHSSNKERFSASQSVLKPCRASSMLEALLASKNIRRSGGCAAKSVSQVGDPEFAARLPLRILVADDNSVNQKVARMMLKKFGYAADLVANGLEAVEAVKKCDYDLVFMDCQMPEMDGFEATRMIRSIEGDRSSGMRAFIYALTANVRDEALEKSKSVGMDGFLAKPIKLGDIKSALEEVSQEIAARN